MKQAKMPAIVLGSASPRRREILARVCPDFRVLVSAAKEVIDQTLPPEQVCQALAGQKADALLPEIAAEELLICADTVVALDGLILGKPEDEADARRMLRLLSGRAHQVYTGLCLVKGEKRVYDVSGGQVFFAPLSEGMIDWYVRSGEPMDKAGAYGIQGKGAALIERMAGDYSAVVGLPLQRLATLMEKDFAIGPFA